MQKWEYEVITSLKLYSNEVDATKDRLNELGNRGWELCNTITDENMNAVFIFKRPQTPLKDSDFQFATIMAALPESSKGLV